MHRILLFLIAAISASCANGPTFVVRSDGTMIANLGQQLFEDTKEESAAITLPNGAIIAYSKTGKSQTKVPLSGIRTYGTVGVAKILEEGLTARTAIPENGATQRAALDAGVKKARIEADVTKATFVPPETVVTPP